MTGRGEIVGPYARSEGVTATSLASRVHDAHHAVDRIEAELCEVVTAACGELEAGDEEEWTTDHYDNSIEVYGVGVIDLDAAAAKLKEAGFSKVWLHQHAPPRGDCKCRAR